jgi:hypothetical protein
MGGNQIHPFLPVPPRDGGVRSGATSVAPANLPPLSARKYIGVCEAVDHGGKAKLNFP